MTKYSLFIGCLAAVVSLAACDDDNEPESAEWEATLTGAAERPDPVTTSATGSAELELDDNRIDFEISFTGLSGAPTGAHIHGPASTEEDVGILVDLSVGLPSATSGSYSGSFTAPSNLNVSLDSLVKLLNAGKAYINVHTTTNPGGEIRGQLARE